MPALNIWEGEAGGSEVQSYQKLHSRFKVIPGYMTSYVKDGELGERLRSGEREGAASLLNGQPWS